MIPGNRLFLLKILKVYVIQVSLLPLFAPLFFVLTHYPGLLIPEAEDNTIGREGTEPMLGMYFYHIDCLINLNPLIEDMDLDDQQILSSSINRYPSRSKLRHRSQTAPEPLRGSHPDSMASALPLRRNQTTPTGHGRSASAHLDALQHAYALITDTGTSQVDVQDLLHARRLANQINQALDEKMCSKIRPHDC